MKNKLSDLNDHLFAQIERLSDESIDDATLEKELKRTGAITSVAKEIVANARLVLDAEIKLSDMPLTSSKPKLLS
ncbi:hypothetical protein EUZ85_19470 [Hahella sp. KA22]|uniref:hypothetical protein n=1 Tax=Hahella sp. KA22 TaxID=1628392 RepID=UPI000FDD87F7|nr:hypothetical protein [Hahella sp. KA22]AZZ92784.1 hypothetical protein ENC22_16890 [Hahella sp. KA22]QAY56158.1 hypothetical protein EUZ85_19470 [Hahella sp. KA22]